MPNHVTNKLKIKGNDKEVCELLDSIKIEKSDDIDVYGVGTIDFNKIIPMPLDLAIESDSFLMPLENQFSTDKTFKSAMDDLRKYYLENPNTGEHKLQNFLQGCENYVKYGYATWYSWAIDNWGTKWNAYNQSPPREILFDTAWSGVPGLVGKLSEQFPNVELSYEFADEDIGYNVGEYTFKNGSIVDNSPANNSKKAYEMGFRLKNYTDEDRKDFRYNEKTNTYQYIEYLNPMRFY